MKFVILITDAPAHGKMYNDEDLDNDNYPEENM
jgi:hypothetical protein